MVVVLYRHGYRYRTIVAWLPHRGGMDTATALLICGYRTLGDVATEL